MSLVAIPIDIYESPREIVILMPLWGVDKKSIEVYFEDFKLVIKWVRTKPSLKDDLVLQQDECYRGEFTQNIQIPPYVYFDRIHSVVTADNILVVTIPKSLQPWGKVQVAVEIAWSRTRSTPTAPAKKTPSKRGRPTKK